jgi:hypothetical protein
VPREVLHFDQRKTPSGGTTTTTMADSKVYFDLTDDLFQIDVGSTGSSTGKVARRLVKWNLGRKHYAVSFPLLTKFQIGCRIYCGTLYAGSSYD